MERLQRKLDSMREECILRPILFAAKIIRQLARSPSEHPRAVHVLLRYIPGRLYSEHGRLHVFCSLKAESFVF